MIQRTYGRRGRGLTRGCSAPNKFRNGVMESSSQDCSEDVYNFSCSSQDCWTDPYHFDSSQEAGRDYDGDRKSKKAKVIDLDTEPESSNSDRETQEEFDGVDVTDFRKSRKPKRVRFDPNVLGSSLELLDLGIPGLKKDSEDRLDLGLKGEAKTRGREGNGVLQKKREKKKIEMNSKDSDREIQEFHGVDVTDFRNSRKPKNVRFDPNVLELVDLGIPVLKKDSGDRLDLGLKGEAMKRDREGNGVLQKKRKKKKKIEMESKDSYVELTATLMETQEGGEMMEHLDEINFALDGLKKGQPFRVRRASLLSLLSKCGTMQQRRLLRSHGMSKTILEAIMELNLDDPPSNYAAAALFYILTFDGQDDRLLGSLTSIRFLVKLLKPISSNSVKDKSKSLTSRLIGLSKNGGLLPDSVKGNDSNTSAIMLKVREILVNCKEMKQNEVVEEPELNHKWVGLLIMEKACSSKISIEETSGTILRSGGNFKEKLREVGGLDAVFEVASRCHCTLEECLQKNPSFSLDSKDTRWMESLALLLKCLKIMENATFLSKDNQGYLLRMIGDFNGQRTPRSVVKLVLRVIKILSDVSLQRSYLKNSCEEKSSVSSYENIDSGICSMESASQKSCDASQSRKSQFPGFSDSVKSRIESSQSGSCSGASQDPEDVVKHIISDYQEAAEGIGGKKKKKNYNPNSRTVDYSRDPFAFDEHEFDEPSKWDVLSGSAEDSKGKGHDEGSREAGFPSAGYGDKSNLIADCILTAVKVLMNMCNENPEGCEHIAKLGGLEILSSLIAIHFPLYAALPSDNYPHLTDPESDLLIAILGSLVNLVEKDVQNRSRLAKATVSVPGDVSFRSEDRRDAISLFCSIFLANQPACCEAAQEDSEGEESLWAGEKEAEKMIVEAYSALLLAFLSTESRTVRNSIGQSLPGRNLRVLVPVLERFVEFHRTLDMISPETHSAVLEVIESCRVP